MNSSRKLPIIVLTFLTLAATAFAQQTSPREQFQAAVAVFQKNATEDGARKLAELYKQLDPPPVVPEDAKFHALKGAAFVKQAGDAAAFGKAATEFSAAIAVAPWVGEYHYNLAVCNKSAGQLSAALIVLKYAYLLARDDKERDDCLALRAELEAAQELANAKEDQAAAAKKTEQDRIARAEEENRRAVQARRDVITRIKRSLAGKTHTQMLERENSYDEIRQKDAWEYAGLGYWKFEDTKATFYQMFWGKNDLSMDRVWLTGVATGPSLADVVWTLEASYFWGKPGDRIWAEINEETGVLYFSYDQSPKAFVRSQRHHYCALKPITQSEAEILRVR